MHKTYYNAAYDDTVTATRNDDFECVTFNLPYPDDAVTAAGDNDIACVPLHEARHGEARDVLMTLRRRVDACQLIPVDAPHVQIRARARRYVTLQIE